MRLPPPVQDGVEAALGTDAKLRAAEPVGGGCVAETARVLLSDERSFFLKYSVGAGAPAGIFASEAVSLAELAKVTVLQVPAVLHVNDASGAAANDDTRWLLLEWLEPGRGAPHTWPLLAASLRALHATRSETFGWSTDNFIGTLPQANTPTGSWPEFWAERRLRPQLRMAVDTGRLDSTHARRFEKLLASLDDVLAAGEQEGSSLLHGDLWSGNLHVLRDGDPALIDPSSYYGHREVDLAMSELFGGFNHLFYAAYHELWPLLPGYAEMRRHVYQLYYLLVHVNMFGAGYTPRTLATLEATGY